jgi:hypothetical protein
VSVSVNVSVVIDGDGDWVEVPDAFAAAGMLE